MQKLGVGKSYGRNDYARHRTPRVGKKRKGLLENPAGHGRQPPPRRHPGGLRRLLPVVHLPARMHRHRRRARHELLGQRHGPVQGKLHPRRGAGIKLPTSLRHHLRQGRHHAAFVILRGGRIPLARTPLLTTPSAGGQHLGACSLVRMATKVGPQTPAPQRPAYFAKKYC